MPSTLPRELVLPMPTGCPLCDAAGPLCNDEDCPSCEARGRSRSLVLLLNKVVLQLPELPSLPLLAFATTGVERSQLAPLFESLISASLYGKYGRDHEEGVDIRDLSRYPKESTAGVYGSLLFDYFPEHELALEQAFRVTAPGGVFFTHIAPYRLLDGPAGPQSTGIMPPRPNILDYVPAEGIPTVVVGRAWFAAAIERAGFHASHIILTDGQGNDIEWFLGVRYT